MNFLDLSQLEGWALRGMGTAVDRDRVRARVRARDRVGVRRVVSFPAVCALSRAAWCPCQGNAPWPVGCRVGSASAFMLGSIVSL